MGIRLSRAKAALLSLALGTACLGSPAARAATPEPAGGTVAFALILGVNKSVDAEMPVLRYADDDAVRYRELFALLGAKTFLLTRLDDNTRRLDEGQLSSLEGASLPRRLELQETVAALGLEVSAAHSQGQKVVFYFVYAGHGNVDDKRGGGARDQAYLALEDGRLTSADLETAVLDRVAADESHLIVDACYSYFLAYGRGPGGKSREVHGFVPAAGLAQRPDVGLLLSTTSARQSHEWEGFQAGVFSHEVRSGLFGAADFDGDGRISYREMAAFVSRANAAIVNEQFRPTVLSHPPKNNSDLLDLRRRTARALILAPGTPVAHYLLENDRGVRLADFHNAQDHGTSILLPASGGLYLRRLSDDQEVRIDAGERDLQFAELVPSAPRIAVRGAASDAFTLIFSLPFDESAWRSSPEAISLALDEPSVGETSADVKGTAPTPAFDPSRSLTRRTLRGAGWATLGLGVGATGLGVGMGLAAMKYSNDAHSAKNNDEAVENNHRIALWKSRAWMASGVAAAGLIVGGSLLWATRDTVQLVADVNNQQASLGVAGRF